MSFKLIRVRSIKNKEVAEWKKSLTGKSCRIGIVRLGERLVVNFPDVDTHLVTTEIVAYNSDWRASKSLIVQTQNTVYVFSEEAV